MTIWTLSAVKADLKHTAFIAASVVPRAAWYTLTTLHASIDHLLVFSLVNGERMPLEAALLFDSGGTWTYLASNRTSNAYVEITLL